MATREGRVTAKDVARAAGVSQSTVSYVLNNNTNQTISEATRGRVLAAVEKLGYAPSAAARALRTGTSSTVMIVLPDAPVGAAIAALIEEVADDLEPHGYSVVFRRHRDTAMLERAWREIMPAAVANLAAFGAEPEAAMEAAGIPVIKGLLDEAGPRVITVPEIGIGRLQAAHLLERGHLRLGYAAPVEGRVTGFYDRRLAGVREVLAAARLPEPVVIRIPLDATGAAAAIAPWVGDRSDGRVTGICAYNDEQAFALLAGMRILGLTAPDDLAVIGVDDVPLAPFASPPLTSVNIDVPAIAVAMSRALLAAVRGETAPAAAAVAAKLVRRQST